MATVGRVILSALRLESQMSSQHPSAAPAARY